MKALFWFGIFVSLALFVAPISTSAAPQIIPYGDKITHAFIFLILTHVCLRAYPNFGRIKCASLLFLYALCIEVIQHLIPYRSFELGDIAADTFGIVLSLML